VGTPRNQPAARITFTGHSIGRSRHTDHAARHRRWPQVEPGHEGADATKPEQGPAITDAEASLNIDQRLRNDPGLDY